jgi:hypothetical protein
VAKDDEDRHLLLQCDCHQGHFIEVTQIRWGDGTNDTYLVLTGDFEATQRGFWDRVKGAFSILFGWRWCWAEVSLDAEKLHRLRDFLAETEPTTEDEAEP